MPLPSISLPLARRLWAWHPQLLAGAWLLMQALFLARYHGPYVAHDSVRYYAYAQEIANRGYFGPGLN